jgi:hypothetical protein
MNWDAPLPEPESAEWRAAIDEAVRAKRFNAEVDRHYAALASDAGSSWEPVDLHEYVFGDVDELVPEFLTREDGKSLLYPGCTHSIHGETGSGKSWLIQFAIAQVLETGGAALYVDYESTPSPIVKRLRRLGVTQDALKAGLTYVRPKQSPDALDIDRVAFAGLLTSRYDVAVVDGANISLALCGLNPNAAPDVAKWHDLILLPIAEKTNAATVAIDHVPKSSERNGFAFGSQHKMAGLTGSAYTVEKVEPFGRGRRGIATLRVGSKDREGYIHGIGHNDGHSDGLLVAEFHMDASQSVDAIKAKLTSPDPNVERNARPGKKVNKKPTRAMELVSLYLERTEVEKDRSKNRIEDSITAEFAGKKNAPTRAEVRLALDVLLKESGGAEPFLTTNPNPRGGYLYTVARPYREAEDREAESYVHPKLKLALLDSDEVEAESEAVDG